MTEPEPRPDAIACADEPARSRPDWMIPFLTALAGCGVVSHAARAAGISLATLYRVRKQQPVFARAWRIVATGNRRRRLSAPSASGDPPLPAGSARPHWRTLFFEALAETSNVSASAARAGVALRTVYKLRREDAEFAARWRAALIEGYDHLEMELLEHLRRPESGRKMDVPSALRLLAAHRETVARERALREDDDEAAVLESIDEFIEGMRQRRLANSAILIEADWRDLEPDNDAS